MQFLLDVVVWGWKKDAKLIWVLLSPCCLSHVCDVFVLVFISHPAHWISSCFNHFDGNEDVQTRNASILHLHTHTPTQTNTGEKTFSHFISIREKSFGLCDKMQLNANEMAVSNGTKWQKGYGKVNDKYPIYFDCAHFHELIRFGLCSLLFLVLLARKLHHALRMLG